MICSKHGEYEDKSMTICGRTFNCGCPACAVEREQEAKKKAEEEETQAKESRLLRRGIEPEFLRASLQNYKAETPSERDALQACRMLADGKIKKVLLLGNNGTGKTHLACSVAQITGGVVTTMYILSARIRQGYNTGKSEIEVMDELLAFPFIAIDEVGRTKGSDSERNWLSYLIDKAHVRGVKLMLISNRQLARSLPQGRQGEAFEYFMDNDVISRLKQNSRIVEISGRDRRNTATVAV